MEDHVLNEAKKALEGLLVAKTGHYTFVELRDAPTVVHDRHLSLNPFVDPVVQVHSNAQSTHY